jgi:GNAT superfamily N-acetyltransferase
VLTDLDRSDHDTVRALILDGLIEHWGHLDPEANPDLDDLSAAYASGRTLVARLASGSEGRPGPGPIVGTGTVVPRSGGVAEIVRMSVDRRLRRSGVGRRIVEELAATARGWGSRVLVLETTSTWTEVVEFYRRCGFVVERTADGDYGPETWMRRPL